jgi:hypothetical protein
MPITPELLDELPLRHLDDEVISEGVGILADEILGSVDRIAIGESRMVS